MQIFQTYLENILRGERRACREIVTQAIETGVQPLTIIQELIWPAMETIDRLFRDDQINTATEHMATRINRFLADQLQAYLPRTPANGRRVLIVCADDEPEELGAQMCADLFESEGWDVYFAGGGVPHDETLMLVGRLRPDLLLIFGSKPSDAPRCRELVRTIREVNANPTMNVMVSGGVFNRADGLWREVQADLFAPTAGDALELARDMAPRVGTVSAAPSGKKRRRRRRPPLLEQAMATA